MNAFDFQTVDDIVITDTVSNELNNYSEIGRIIPTFKFRDYEKLNYLLDNERYHTQKYYYDIEQEAIKMEKYINSLLNDFDTEQRAIAKVYIESVRKRLNNIRYSLGKNSRIESLKEFIKYAVPVGLFTIAATSAAYGIGSHIHKNTRRDNKK
jgi:hypothetical protein